MWQGTIIDLMDDIGLENHAVIASGLPQVGKQFKYLLAQKVNKVIPYLLY